MQKDFNEQALEKRCMSTVQLLIDIENLAHADYMTGTLNSGIPYLVEVCQPHSCDPAPHFPAHDNQITDMLPSTSSRSPLPLSAFPADTVGVEKSHSSDKE